MSKRDFPLSYHNGSGLWKRKVPGGRIVYFGKDKQAALNKWLAEKDYWLAGRDPRKEKQAKPVETVLSVQGLVNRFLYAKELLVESGEMKRTTWKDYEAVCGLIVKAFTETRQVASLGPEDFQELRASFAKGDKKPRGLVSISNLVTRTRVVFKYADEVLNVRAKLGPDFKKPKKSALRAERKRKYGKRGLMFTAADVHALLSKAEPDMRAMILLGLNGALGNTDILRFSTEHIDGNWLDYPRPKTSVDRWIPLWPETREALAAVVRPEPARPDFADRIFLTPDGLEWRTDQISTAFAKLLDACGLKRAGLNFYSLRRTFRTVADETGDQPACDGIMGHTRNDMASIYRQKTKERRLLAVVKYVRRKLLRSKSVDTAATAAA
jgi:integrase